MVIDHFIPVPEGSDERSALVNLAIWKCMLPTHTALHKPHWIGAAARIKL
jgi:hypothetical protein